MADVTKINGYIIKDANAPHPSNAGSAGQVLKKTETGTEWADASFKPAGKSYLTFSSPNSFTLKVNDNTKHWDGTLEYFSSNRTWTTWDGTTTLSSVDNDGEYVLYLRGTGNTVITGNDQNYRWVLTGSNIACIGNIENLLDYATIESGNHPTMADYCYTDMFSGCTSLTQAPALPATTLPRECYSNMFKGCTNLTQAPALPATTLANYCYYNMFSGCTSLTQAPALPATTLANYCYNYMFQDCTSLTQAPALPATTLANYCYQYMFKGCTNLTQAPALPATTLVNYCYQYMFYGCISLTQVPTLPATTLASSCYYSMFYGCTSLTKAPALPATTLADYCYYSMFYGCTSLTQAPALPATTLTDRCYYSMFYGCTSLTQAPTLPATTLATNCYRSMFYGCTSLKLSSTQTDEYMQEYRIPVSGTGTSASNALTNMFTSTGGTFTGTPEINTTYYLSSDNMIVRETEIATLNGYVGSMIMVGAIPVNEKGAANGVASLGADGKVPSAQLPEMGGKAYTVLLRSTGWAQSGDRYSQTVNVTGVTASTPVVMVDVDLSGTDIDADAAALEAWGIVSANNVAQGDGTLTFYARSVPSVNVPVNVGVC